MNRPKKTLILGEAFFPEDFLINDLASEWERAGRDFEVLTRAPSYPFGKVYKGYRNKIYQVTRFGGVKVHRFPVLQGYAQSKLIKILNYFTFVFWSCLVVLFIGRRFDRVFVYQTGPLTLTTAAVVLKKLYGARVTIWTQDLWPESVYAYGFKKTKLLSRALDGFVGWIYRNCDQILVSCEGFAGSLRKYVPGKTIRYAPNWPLGNSGTVEKEVLPGRFNFTFAGNVGRVQNLDNVVRGFHRFVARRPDIYLNIVGDGSYLEELKQLVVEEKIPNVNFAGRRPLAEMPGYFAASDVLILSLKDVSLYEITVPSKFQSYLTACKPIYGIFRGEVKRMIEHYHLGLTADPSDIEAIAKGFESLLNLSESDRQKFAKNADHILNSVFNREKVIRKIDHTVWD